MKMTVINVKDMVEPNGLTVEQNNLQKSHKYHVGDLVEVKLEEWFGDGACQITHSRLWIVSLDRDCDGTPLYSLSRTPKHQWEPNISTTLDKFTFNTHYSQSFFYNVKTGVPEHSLTLIPITKDLQYGKGCLTWSKDLE